MRRLRALVLPLVGALACSRGDSAAPQSLVSAAPVTTTGAVARQLLATPDFAWKVMESPHARIHVVAGSETERNVGALADSIESARAVALRTLGEADRPGEAKLELFLVDSRDLMWRLVGRPIGGFAQPGELTAGFVAGAGYRPFFRHELTHAYASVRWGRLEAGDWLTEGLAALAQGPCQGHAVDAIAAGYLQAGDVPPLPVLRDRFRELRELPSYMAAASVVGFVAGERGMAQIRALWRGAGRNPGDGIVGDARATHPLGADGDSLEARWRSHLGGIAPARLDSVRLIGEGC